MLQMDSQFNSLLQSYNSNYVQHKITGKPSYQAAYESAKQGIDSIISQLQDQVDTEKSQIADFYKSGVEQKLIDQQQNNQKTQSGILTENDEIIAAKIRAEQPILPAVSAASISTTQYITMGVLVVAIIGLQLL
jgi:hypothetical protein